MTGTVRNRAPAKYVAAVILFGSNGVVASQIAMSSYDIVFTRTLIGALFLSAVFLASRARPTCWRDRRQFAFLLISGVAMGASWLFLFEAYVQVGVSVAILGYYCGPVIVMMLAPLVFRERLTLASVIGFVAVIIGMLCVNGQALALEGISPGLVFAILAAATYAVMVIFNKKATSITGLENPMWQLIAAFGTVALFLLFRRGLAIQVPPGSWLPVLVLGLLNTGVGCYLYFSSIGAMRAQSVAILGYLEPLSALFFAAVFLGETLTPLQMVGAALILGGTVAGELLRLRTVAGHAASQSARSAP